MDQDATWIKMRHGSRCNEDHYATRIKTQQGSKWNEDKDKQLEEQLEHLKDQTKNEALN